jgi:hypothetical protein
VRVVSSRLAASVRRQSRKTWAGVSAVPQLQLGVMTPGTRCLNKKACSPMQPVRSCVSAVLSCFRSSRCFLSTSFVKSGLSAASAYARLLWAGLRPWVSLCHLSRHSHSAASGVCLCAAHATAHSAFAGPLPGSTGLSLRGRPLPFLRRSDCATAAQVSLISCAFPERWSLSSKSANLVLR